MDAAADMDRQLDEFAACLRRRKDEVLAAWRKAVQEDEHLANSRALSRTQFDDHMPEVLAAFADELQQWPGRGVAAAEAAQRKAGERHGAHRWQQGYYLPQVAAEWRHLQLVLLDEVESYAAGQLDLAGHALAYIRRALVTLCAQGVERSIAEYVRLQQAAAAGRVRELETAIDHLQRMQRQRAEVWRQAAHDLRDNVGLVSNATNVLSHPAADDAIRTQSIGSLERGVSSLRALLEDLLSLARLEAGQERLTVAAFDAGELLANLCHNAQALAQRRGLTLTCEGPDQLPVEGDAVKVHRIAQNLLMNALKYTRKGGVTIGWGPREGTGDQWFVEVIDTGPGVNLSARTPIVRVLKAVTDDNAAGADAAAGSAEGPSQAEAEGASSGGDGAPGEGLGLSIVKQLCDLLDATLELESEPGSGTTVRVLLPAHYAARAA
jgi:signal transduction histidine kinase